MRLLTRQFREAAVPFRDRGEHGRPAAEQVDVWALLDEADSAELLALGPVDGPGEDDFHGWAIQGRLPLDEAADRASVIDEIRGGVENSDGTAEADFTPRHGLSATSGGRQVDLVICYACRSLEAYADGRPASHFLTSSEPAATFDARLAAAGVQVR